MNNCISVELIDHMGSDLTIVNAARVSMEKQITEMREQDSKLIHHLAHHAHMSPFRHVFFQFRIRAPEFVARQAFKHNVGISATAGPGCNVDTAWNEVSMRYVRMKEFYTPSEWRKAPKEIRQGSAVDDSFTDREQQDIKMIYSQALEHCITAYQSLLNANVAREMARMILPLSVETQWIWTMSLQAIIHFIKLRHSAEAQSEIRELANQMETLVRPFVPIAFDALMASPHS
jgi:thymidylate synthase (FAD)